MRFDVDSYRLFLAVHFIDPRSGSEIGFVPVTGYRAGNFSVFNCLKGALQKVAIKVGHEISRSGKEK